MHFCIMWLLFKSLIFVTYIRAILNERITRKCKKKTFLAFSISWVSILSLINIKVIGSNLSWWIFRSLLQKLQVTLSNRIYSWRQWVGRGARGEKTLLITIFFCRGFLCVCICACAYVWVCADASMYVSICV